MATISSYVIILIVSIVITILGAGITVNGYKRYHQRKKMKSTEETPLNHVRQGETRTRGVIKPKGDGITAPVTGEDAVFVSYDITSKSGLEQDYLGSGKAAQPFYLTDETNSTPILVDGENVELRTGDAHKTSVTVDVTDTTEIPESVTKFEDETGETLTERRELDSKFSSDYKHLYEQEALTDGDTVSISGKIVPIEQTQFTDPNATYVLTEPNSADGLFVTDTSGEESLTGVKALIKLLAELSIGPVLFVGGLILTLIFIISLLGIVFM